MQKHTRALAHQPVDDESVRQYSTQILTQMGEEPNDRSLEYMRLLLEGNDDSNAKKLLGMTLAQLLAAAIENVATGGVGKPEEVFAERNR